ncbi:hypothetical protein KVT40_007046 [Elsinoe batatas]|uniref:Uncharacterized protein n=1 Tax=Elsinoe batatas TaxID=2601811 RepID=A0A8K0KXY2_9PEZI|nr:hypothetical protein KVT40_007046 [Elsinoe batatas]
MSAPTHIPDHKVTTFEHGGSLLWTIEETRAVRNQAGSWSRGRKMGEGRIQRNDHDGSRDILTFKVGDWIKILLVAGNGQERTDFALVLAIRQCGLGASALRLCVSWGKLIGRVKYDRTNEDDATNRAIKSGVMKSSIVLSNHIALVSAPSVVGQVDEERDDKGSTQTSGTDGEPVLLCDNFRMHKTPGEDEIVFKYGTIQQERPEESTMPMESLSSRSSASGSLHSSSELVDDAPTPLKKSVGKLMTPKIAAANLPYFSGRRSERTKATPSANSTMSIRTPIGRGNTTNRKETPSRNSSQFQQ